MKTLKQNVMKTKITHIVLIAVLLISSVNVFAGGKKTLKQNRVNASSIINLVSFEKAEAELEMENWMTSYKNFNFENESNFETEMNFEAWMLNSFSIEKIETLDQEMNFESWMMSPFITTETAEFTDEELHFESWMLKF